ncbi:DnaD domain-containing protein [Alteribacter populi]|uniref:DnaD domain-containing protein n=1 Tax=Alteribacter populi TaxID=2011011 RepID=UPI0018E2B5C2|nr:DnaD domain protein [Alteribacter populi]
MKPKDQLGEKTWWRYLLNLKKWGMLSVKSSNKYSVVTIDNYDVYQDSGNNIDQQNDQQLTSKWPSSDQQLTTNNNVNNYNNDNKSSSVNARENPYQFFQDNFGVLGSFISESIGKWCDDLSGEIVLAAMKSAAKSGGSSFSYIESILKEWAGANLKTIDDVRAYEIERKHKQSRIAKGGGSHDSINSGSNGQAKRKDSITGGQTGWIGRKQA